MTHALSLTWEMTGTAAGQAANPLDLVSLDGQVWHQAMVPGTVAQVLAAMADTETLSDLDASDWWYRADLSPISSSNIHVTFHGLACLAEAWIDNQLIHRSSNMFRSFRVAADLTDSDGHYLLIVFRSVSRHLTQRWPRPRWKTALVDHQSLRFLRTSLIGYTPTLAPEIPLIGPYQKVDVSCGSTPTLGQISIRTSVSGSSGRVLIQAPLHGQLEARSKFLIECAGQQFPLALNTTDAGTQLSADLTLPDIDLWWPNGCGQAALYSFQIQQLEHGQKHIMHAGTLGFCTVSWDNSGALFVNDQKVFARGACWSSANPLACVDTTNGDAERLLRQLRDAGANMVRICATGIYPSTDFLSLCDQLGLMIWQDFMFANMDYPEDDQELLEEITAEVDEQVNRLLNHPCLTAVCGSSETEQQAAMMGQPPAQWINPVFSQLIAQRCKNIAPQIPYFPSSPTGGDLPFHVNAGIAHYFGVGAYRKPPEDARISGVRFATECLGISHVPDTEYLCRSFANPAPPCHLPEWKQGVPRDRGAGWDFEDVRDHYLEQRFGAEAIALRWTDQTRYLALSRAVTGELLHEVYQLWRYTQSASNGGLLLATQDMRVGAGWGVIDASGRPKPAWYYLKRAWTNVLVALIDEGLNGHVAEVINERPEPLAITLRVQLIDCRYGTVISYERDLNLGPWDRQQVSVDAMAQRLHDTTASYQFGPPGFSVIVAQAIGSDGATLNQSIAFPNGRNLPSVATSAVKLLAETQDNCVILQLSCTQFLDTVSLHLPNHLPEDNFFALIPGERKTVRCSPEHGRPNRFRGQFSALNLLAPINIPLPGPD